MKIAHYNKMLPDCLLDIHSPPPINLLINQIKII